ncbi:AAA family ATPase [Candidatus Micrarchaeota archaeon]|nr:AAA family ATPase [Candidatus Micrarchaeota archaeon]
MKLESLELENIRSYAQTSIDFQDGVTLLEGDVGSGKSTVLYAIEFALFGLGDLKAGHVLRHGTDVGSVELALDVNGKKIRIHRALERKKTAKQLPGWIEEDGLRTEYSPEELKVQVLKLLEFRENPSPKATSCIFRYAVFTPQEQMKEILGLKPEERLQTLRKAFGVEEYKTAQEHTALVQRFYREKTREHQGALLDLPEWLDKKNRLEEKKQGQKRQTAQTKDALLQAGRRLEDAQRKIDELEKQALALEKVGAELPLWESRIRDLENQIQNLERQKKESEKQRLEIDQKIAELAGRLQSIPENAAQELGEAEKTFYRMQSELGAAQQKAKEFAQLQNGACPTCGQKIQGSLAERVAHAQEELLAKTRQCEAAKNAYQEARRLRDAWLEQKNVQDRQNDLEAQRERLSQHDLEPDIQRLQNQRLEWQAQRNAKAQDFAAFRDVQNQRENARKARDAEREEESRLQQIQARLDAEARNLEEQLAEAERVIHEKTATQKELEATKRKAAWLEEHFQPALSQIEQHVLRHINDEFNHAFRKHLTTLLESPDVDAEVDDAFTPQIQQQGYEQDWTALSGGEKSALALAYRLALNQLVRQTTPSLQNNLLMLDEPTDGFSKEQLSRMRDTLNAVGAKQVILVSHERELEAFCDQVYLVQKQDGRSTVKAL